MDFLVPKLSATMESAKVLRWLKQVGDKVAIGEPLVELETDKAAMEVESPVDATLEAVLAEEGAELPIGGALARLATQAPSREAAETTRIELAAPPPTRETRRAAAGPVGSTETGPPRRVLASPLARRLAQINGIDLAGLAGGEQLGRLRKRDVLAALAARSGEENRRTPIAGFAPHSRMRAQIAEAVSLSRRTIPSFVLDRWVETAAIDRVRAALAGETERTNGVKTTFTDFLLFALAAAFAAHPRILDRWGEQDGQVGRIASSAIDIGLVVALDDGMMLPVLRDLGGKPLGEIARARHAAVARVRSGRLLQSDYAPVAFSLSNIGPSGADRFEAIIIRASRAYSRSDVGMNERSRVQGPSPHRQASISPCRSIIASSTASTALHSWRPWPSGSNADLGRRAEKPPASREGGFSRTTPSRRSGCAAPCA
jgi:pyruvate dehydrogenase E2 component (dihydrolipoamide acetyltransferase)